MSVKIVAKSGINTVKNPANDQITRLVNITFVEEGRSGLNKSLSNSTAALASALGIKANMGLDTGRTCTVPVAAEEADALTIGQEIPNLHINRTLYSLAAMAQQEGVDAAMINGKPTFVACELSAAPMDDNDQRMDNETLLKINPDAFKNVRHGGGNVTAETRALPTFMQRAKNEAPVSTETSTAITSKEEAKEEGKIESKIEEKELANQE